MRIAVQYVVRIVLLIVVCLAGALPRSVANTRIKRPIATGKDFYIVFPKAAWGNQSVGVLINSPSKQRVIVTTPAGQKGTIDFPKPKTTIYYSSQFRIEQQAGIVKRQEATRIQSPNPISVHGQFGVGGISGTYTAIPVTSWGTEYYAVAPPEGINSDYFDYPTIYSVPMITIIGSHKGTVVTITPTSNTSNGNLAGVPFNVSLNQGDVYSITSNGDPAAVNRVEDPCEADLTGTHVESNYPVGMLCAQSHSSWPCGYNSCGDYCVEFIPPVANWDSMYVVTPSVPRLGAGEGEQLRILFGYNGTELIVDDGQTAPRVIGNYAAGDFIDYPSPIGAAIVLSASKPILPVEFTTKPASCIAGSSGSENWTLGMVVMAGVNQWGDYTPFSTAIGSQSVANICFRYSDAPRLKLNGAPLLEQYPEVNRLPQGYASVSISINAGSYNELTGDSGATAGGSVFGFGTLKFAPNNDGGEEHVETFPSVVKSFCHPIGVNALPSHNPDNTPPHVSDTMSCGHWDITGFDDELLPPATGLYDVYLSYDAEPDSSFNVAFNPPPTFDYGDSRSNLFGIDVVNLAQPAQAALHFRDGAGNEYDTVLKYVPQVIDASPALLDFGAVRTGTSDTGIVTLFNRSSTVAYFNTFRLRYGAAHHWHCIPPSPTAPFSIAPGDSAKFYFAYDAPTVSKFEFDTDTLIVSTCKEFPIAALASAPKKPAILTQCFDFGNGTIDTPPLAGGDTISSGRNVFVTSVGNDTLRITNISIQGILVGDGSFPESDFNFSGKYFKVGAGNIATTLAFPTAAVPWQLAPQETAFVEVLGHPHHAGPRGLGLPSTSPANCAYVYFENDAQHTLMDSACLTMVGLRPGIFAAGIDYGTHLYATTKDSFFVVRNSGQIPVTIFKQGFDNAGSPDSSAFVFHQYTDAATGSFLQYNVNDSLKLFPADTARGLPADTVRVPYRFIAKRLGLNTDTIVIYNTSPDQPKIYLTGNVIEPRIDATGNCSTDSVLLGRTVTQDISIGNAGTDSLVIENVVFGATSHAADWSISTIVNVLTGAPLQVPFTLALNSNATVTLLFRPDTIGPVSANVHIIGRDRLGRHSADSVNGFAYRDSIDHTWGLLPYDTTVSICNRAYAGGIAARDLFLEQYVTKDTSGVFFIRNLGTGPITVTDAKISGQDYDSAFVNAAFEHAFPFEILPGDSSPVTVKFSPNGWTGMSALSGRRNYNADFTMYNSSGTPCLAHFTGRGHGVDIHSFIARNYVALPKDYAKIPIVCDRYDDTLGLTDIRGFVMTMTHYHRTAIHDRISDDVVAANQQGTASEGAIVRENTAEDTIHDAAHLNGEQGFLELAIKNIPKTVVSDATPFNLMNLYFQALMGLDTSELNFTISQPVDVNGAPLEYVNSTTSPGFILVDSICGLNIAKVSFHGGALALLQNAPNPFPGVTNISFSQPFNGQVKLTVLNAVGEIVATPVDQYLQGGAYSVEVDGSLLASGLYTYRLETTGGTLQKQMMRMR